MAKTTQFMFEKKVITNKDKEERLFITYFYVGMEYVNRGEKERGKKYLQLCLKNADKTHYMYKLAKEKLEKMGNSQAKQ